MPDSAKRRPSAQAWWSCAHSKSKRKRSTLCNNHRSPLSLTFATTSRFRTLATVERAGIRPKAAGDYSDASGAASLSQKAAVVAASQPRLDAMARQLQQVDQLKEHVEPPYLREMDDMCERLRRLETAHVTARAGAAQLQRRVDELLTAYGTAMAAVNMKFVEWDEALSEQESLLASGVDS
ncbi:hypothetical protein JKP88DRAFT_261040 [Tribonema minus]|uniref:Uncharacterized protein n=1 Tax=Tribonema minus TaxID=303371 RepID=A0A835YWV4_9STRA|nr:hypothetical protein JKP88DRAFT_261040 [Tribonema minus]